MMDTYPTSLRENAPLYLVGLLLLCLFAGLALFGRGAEAGLMPGGEAAGPAPLAAEELASLPASAHDTVLQSDLSPEDARARNAAAALAAGGVGVVTPFVFGGTMADRERATGCLALAALAEAGSGDVDQRAVMQVILNRVRHPAFANTVCGVVFEGSQRRTGCQFSFTCDGSLSRRYADSAMRAARQRAAEALGGYVYAPVGNATHYHADYVYPWWSPKLDKIAVQGPHIFYRWRGPWGESQALSASYRGAEPDPLALRTVAEAVEHPEITRPSFIDTGETVQTITAIRAAPPAMAGTTGNPANTAPGSPAPGVHFVLVSAADSPAALVERARALCPGDRYCQVYGWSDPSAIPAALPLGNEARRSLSFSFLPARQGNGEAIFFDCRTFPSPATGRCLPRARP